MPRRVPTPTLVVGLVYPLPPPPLHSGDDSIINQFTGFERDPAEGGNEQWQAKDIGKPFPASADGGREHERRFIWPAAGAEGRAHLHLHLPRVGEESEQDRLQTRSLDKGREDEKVDGLGGNGRSCWW